MDDHSGFKLRCTAMTVDKRPEFDLGSTPKLMDKQSELDEEVTAAMEQEEQNLNRESAECEETMRKDCEMEWREMEKSEREEKYRKLKCLLYKSNHYTQYLLERIKKADEEDMEKKRVARKKKELRQKSQQNENQASIVPMCPIVRKCTRLVKEGEVTITENAQVGDGESKENEPTGKHKRKRGAHSEDNMNSKKSRSSQKSSCRDPLSQEPHSNVYDDKAVEFSVLGPSHDDAVDKHVTNIDGKKVPEDQPALFIGGVLRSYQVAGFIWLKTLYENGINGLLADEMGLGKTAQTIALICYLIENNVNGPYMICAPLSTLTNWIEEFRRFSPQVPIILYHGDKSKRSILRRGISRIYNIYNMDNTYRTQPVIITSYEIAIRDKNMLKNYTWQYLAVDEGQRIKNTNCLLIKQLRLYRSTHRLLLTGTPLQNNLSELWSLLNFLLPEIFDELDSFNSWFDIDLMTKCDNEVIAEQAKREDILHMLHQILSPFMLRRLKADVDLDIPPKKELLVYAPLVDIQCKYYNALLNKTISQLNKTEKSHEEQTAQVKVNSHGRPVREKCPVNYSNMCEMDENSDSDEENIIKWFEGMESHTGESKEMKVKVPRKESGRSVMNVSLSNILMQLRKTSNHPYLIEYPLTVDGDYQINESIVTCSGKMMLLNRMLSQLNQRGHKVLIFSQMTRMLDIIQDYLTLRSFPFCRFDGNTDILERQNQITEFNINPQIFVFLLSTRAGGLGINLTTADTVIIYDSDWNPQIDLQAQDRCHRIGQTKPVMVYRYVTSDSVDQTIVEKAAGKRKLEKMVIQKGKFVTGVWSNKSKYNTSISENELLSLLRRTDHSGVVKGHGNDIISDQDLDRLLDRSHMYEQM